MVKPNRNKQEGIDAWNRREKMNHTTDKNYKSLAISIVSLAVSDIERYSRYISRRSDPKFDIFIQIGDCSCLEDYLKEHEKLMRYLATHGPITRKGLQVAIKKAMYCFSAVTFLKSQLCEEICDIHHEAKDILEKYKGKYIIV